METLLLAPLAMAGLAWLSLQDRAAFFQQPLELQALVVASGPITAIPLLLFASGARRIPLSLLGLLQYIAPTLQLLIGVLLFDEAFTPARLLGFAIIWTALVIYSAEGGWQARQAGVARARAEKLRAREAQASEPETRGSQAPLN